jgi:hypothetical protein
VPRARLSAGLLFCYGEISSQKFGIGFDGGEISSHVFDSGYVGGEISSPIAMCDRPLLSHTCICTDVGARRFSDSAPGLL